MLGLIHEFIDFGRYFPPPHKLVFVYILRRENESGGERSPRGWEKGDGVEGSDLAER